MKKFNVKIGRKVTFNSDPFEPYYIESINENGTLNIHQGRFRVTNVTIDKLVR